MNPIRKEIDSLERKTINSENIVATPLPRVSTDEKLCVVMRLIRGLCHECVMSKQYIIKSSWENMREIRICEDCGKKADCYKYIGIK